MCIVISGIIENNHKTSQGGKMNDIDELIKTADRLCENLSKYADDEKRFGADLCYTLEMISCQAWRSANDLKEAIDYYGVYRG